jgi:uncharacterized membrane protein YphA (DoxX/SURF4 family)
MTERVLRMVSRYLLGTLFIFSGFVKSVDPLGSAYKFTDYFEAFGWDFLSPMALVLAILLSSAELLIGLCLFFKLRMKITAWALLCFMLFFTLLTLYDAIKNPVTDCGCFGDALVLTNWQTFFKNIIFLVPAIIVFWQRNNYETEFNILFEWGLAAILFLAGIFISVYSYKNLPLIDFRPYHIGANIPESMIVPEGLPRDEYEVKLFYAKGKEQKEFTLENAPYSDTSWKWIETKNVLIKKGFEPLIHDFSLISEDGNDVTQQLLTDQGYSFLIVSNKLENTDREGLITLNRFATKALTNGYQVYGMTASTSDEVDSMKSWLKPVFSFYATDEITLKTMIRSNPGLMLIKDGTVIGMWHYRNIPDDRILHSNSLSYTLTEAIDKDNTRIAAIVVLIVGLSALILFICRGRTGVFK